MKTKPRSFYIAIIVTLAGFSSTVCAQNWSSPQKLSSGKSPDLTIDRNTGRLHALVMDNFVTYVLVDKNGNKIREEDVPGTGVAIGGWRNGATIAVDSNGQPHVAYHKHLGGDYYDAFYLYKSGSSWTNALQLSQNVWRGYSIRMATDSNDEVHLIQGVPDVDGKVWGKATYYRISNGSVRATKAGLKQWRIDDHLEIDTYGNRDIYMVLSSPDKNGKVNFHFSSDNGASFSGPVNIRATNNDDGRPGNGDVFADLFNNVHLVYGTGEDPAQNVQPAVRYHRRKNGAKVRDVAVTDPGELLPWHLSTGIGTVAASDNGRQIVVAYLVTDGGELRARISNDQGVTWSNATTLANQVGCCESRDKPVIRANGRRFYVAYESNDSVWLRWIELDPLPPLAVAGGPYTGKEGQIINFDASQSTADGAISQYAWDWQSDGIYDDSTDTAIFPYAFSDDFTGTVTLRVTDNGGIVDTAQTSVTITNAPPTISINASNTATEGDIVTFTAAVSDPGSFDTFSDVSWTFGDGNAATGASVTNTFVDNGQFTVNAEVSDDDGASGSNSFQITINNAPPVANAGGPYVAVINENITFTGTGTDPGTNDVLIFAWDVNNDGVFETPGTQASNTFTALGTFIVRFKATDNDDDSNIDNADVFVGNGGPLALAIPDQRVNEGQVFAVLNLDNYVNDPNNSDDEIRWSYFGNTNLSVTISNRKATVLTPNPDWWGQESINFVSTDPLGFTDTTSATFIVNSVNDDPVISRIPSQSAVGANGSFQPVLLDNYVTDIDDPKSALVWSASGHKELFVTVANRVATITRPNNNWFGSEVIIYTVTDTSGASDSMSVRYTAKQFNDAPVMSAIPSQTINENQPFAPVNLDQFVDDPDNDDTEMSWSVFGHRELKVNLSIDRIVTIAPPDSEWAKSEQISFVARDPWNNADTSSATFTVVGINDPPVLSGFGEYSINEDDSVTFSLQQLDTMIVDPDHSNSELQYEFIGQTNLRVVFDENNGLVFYTKEDWNGVESAWFRVSDGTAWNIMLIKITAIPQPDAPKPFDLKLPVFNQNYLVIPETIAFTWSPTDDPDEGDTLSHYSWEISADDGFSALISKADNLTDTTTTFPARLFLREPATFQKIFWRVFAHSTDGSQTVNRLQGRFTIGVVTDVEDDPADRIPNSIALFQNYPNPFNPSTKIVFELPSPSTVKLVIYNMAGHVVRTLANGFVHAGRHRLEWDARDDAGKNVASGIYIYKLETPQYTLSRKMILMQ